MYLFVMIGIALAFVIWRIIKSSKRHDAAIPTAPGRQEISRKLDYSIELAKFPDRTDAILFHKQAVLNAVNAGNLETANLSFAKLVESVRQQNANLDGAIASDLDLLRRLYDSFREEYGLQYPVQFLPPKARAANRKDDKTGDPYLICNCAINPSTPKKYIPFADTIKKKSEWEAIGFRITVDKHGNCKTGRKYVFFRLISRFNDVELEAIRTGKKCSTNPRDVLIFLEHGCTYDDFASVSEDVKSYCTANSLFKTGQLEAALTEANKATTLEPKESLYKDLSIQIRFNRNDLSAISDDIAYHVETYGDISSMVHSGRAEGWLKLLFRLGELQKANDFEQTVNRLFDDQLAKKSVYKRPEGIKYIVDGSEEAGEQLAVTVHNNEVAFIKAKREQFNNCIIKLKEKQRSKAENRSSK